MKNPIISIVLSVYNGGASLHRCLQSIQQQTYNDYEIICFDDASTDNTQTILREYAKLYGRNSFTITTNKTNIGLTKSLNKGITKAKGTYIARIDSDDEWSPRKLETQVSWMQKHPDFGIVGTWYVNRENNRTYHVVLPTHDRQIKKSIFRRNPFGHSCVVMRKEVIDKVGMYDETLQYGQDLDLWFRALPHTKFHNIDQYLCMRNIDEKINKQKQMISHVKTTHTYIRKYHAPLINYLYMIEPALVMITPRWIRKTL